MRKWINNTIALVVVVVVVFTLWRYDIMFSYRLLHGNVGFKGYEGNNTVFAVGPQSAFRVTGDNPGIRSPLLAWPIGIPLKKYKRIVILAAVIVRDASGQEVDGGLDSGEVYIKDQTGRWGTGGWNNPFQFDQRVEKNGKGHAYHVDLSSARPDLHMLKFSIELTEGPAPGTTEKWIIHEVRFE